MEDSSSEFMADSELSSTAENEEERQPAFIAFGVLILAMSVGIATRTTLSKRIP